MKIHGDPAVLLSLTAAEKARLGRGESIARGHKTYQVCFDCRKLVRSNKPIVGALHFCEEG